MFKNIVSFLLFFTPVLNGAGLKGAKSELYFGEAVAETDLYGGMNLASSGLSSEVFELAFTGFKKLKAAGRLSNPDILTIVDFSQTSRNKRLYVIDFEKQELVHHTFVSHGRNSGDEFATRFSNVNGSWQSSLGFYITEGINIGATVGYSLLMEGIEKGFNDNAKKRQIIVHGADYATEAFIGKTGRLGRSFGCPAVPPEMIKPIVSTIRDGSCLFVYYPDPEYLNNSTLLN